MTKRPLLPSESSSIEKTVQFLVTKYSQSGHNPKPVILHSLRIAFHLLELGYGETVVVGALLHDLIEDSDVTQAEITDTFGKKIGDLVTALSFDPAIPDKAVRYKEAFVRIKSYGYDALIIKAADLIDNSLYIRSVNDVRTQKQLVEKIGYFLKTAQLIRNEPVWKVLKQRYTEEQQRLPSA